MRNTARPGSASVATGVDDTRPVGLRRWNLALTVLHAGWPRWTTWLQDREIGTWRSYAYGEKAYLY